MSPEKALELVTNYGKLTHGIKAATRAIGGSLNLCRGISGERNVIDPFVPPNTGGIDSKGRELDLHLVQWYTPSRGEYGVTEWDEVSIYSAEECPHCYAAHIAIQHRKELKKQLGIVRRSMSRAAA